MLDNEFLKLLQISDIYIVLVKDQILVIKKNTLFTEEIILVNHLRHALRQARTIFPISNSHKYVTECVECHIRPLSRKLVSRS